MRIDCPPWLPNLTPNFPPAKGFRHPPVRLRDACVEFFYIDLGSPAPPKRHQPTRQKKTLTYYVLNTLVAIMARSLLKRAVTSLLCGQDGPGGFLNL